MRSRWAPVDDGLVSGRLLRSSDRCQVCGEHTSVILVNNYAFPDGIPWTATIITVHLPEETIVAAAILGVGCGCYSKLHRQVARIDEKRKASRAPA